MATLRGRMRAAGFHREHLGGNVTGYVRETRGGEIIIQETGAGRAPSRLSDHVCAYWIGREHGEPLHQVCGDLDEVLAKARKRK